MARFEVQEGNTDMGGEMQWINVGPVYKDLQHACECISARRKQYAEQRYGWPKFRIKETEVKYHDG